jgi:hypothetical protein
MGKSREAGGPERGSARRPGRGDGIQPVVGAPPAPAFGHLSQTFIDGSQLLFQFYGRQGLQVLRRVQVEFRGRQVIRGQYQPFVTFIDNRLVTARYFHIPPLLFS